MLQGSDQRKTPSGNAGGADNASRFLQGLDLGRDMGYSVVRFDDVLHLDIETHPALKEADLSAIEKRVLRFYENPPRRRARPHHIPRRRAEKLKAKKTNPKKNATVTGRISKSLFDLHYLRRFIDDRDFFRNQYLGEFMTPTGRWKSPELKMDAYRQMYIPRGITGLRASGIIIDDPLIHS